MCFGIFKCFSCFRSHWFRKDYAQGSIRFSLGQNNTKAEIDYVIKTLKEITTRLESL